MNTLTPLADGKQDDNSDDVQVACEDTNSPSEEYLHEECDDRGHGRIFEAILSGLYDECSQMHAYPLRTLKCGVRYLAVNEGGE